jgi:hypothetical protein
MPSELTANFTEIISIIEKAKAKTRTTGARNYLVRHSLPLIAFPGRFG